MCKTTVNAPAHCKFSGNSTSLLLFLAEYLHEACLLPHWWWKFHFYFYLSNQSIFTKQCSWFTVLQVLNLGVSTWHVLLSAQIPQCRASQFTINYSPFQTEIVLCRHNEDPSYRRFIWHCCYLWCRHTGETILMPTLCLTVTAMCQLMLLPSVTTGVTKSARTAIWRILSKSTVYISLYSSIK